MILGFSTLKSLVVAASLKQVYKPYGLTEKMLWEHSFGAGLAARIIAEASHLVNAEEAFLGGLFHDIGKIIMNNMDSKQFQSVMQKCYNDRISFLEAERQVYSYNHAEVGALVIKKWNFPEILMYAVLKHHTFDFEPDEDLYRIRLACVVGLANLFCHRVGAGMREPEDFALHETPPAIVLDIGEEQLNPLFETFVEAFNRDKGIFS
jgi:putative nucleotidyltransferase with HDIG domain